MIMGNLTCCNKKKKTKKIVLLLVGLDNAGKSVAVKGLAGESLDEVVPTVGLSVVNLKYKTYPVKIFDLGGGTNIREIWEKYFVDVHGIIFVIDSSDFKRLDEAQQVLNELLSHEKITGKPILVLANKQDQVDSLDEIEFLEKLKIEELVNHRKCPAFVQTCSATEANYNSKLDQGIHKGYNWLLRYIIRFYATLNARVERDVREQKIQEQEERMEKMERLRKLNAVKKSDEDLIESYSDYVNGNAFDCTPNGANGPNEIFVIHSSNKILESTSSASNESFPLTYYPPEPLQERPKSAVQLVKEQLEKETVQRKYSFRSLISNKTAPVHLYDGSHPRSAFERRNHFSDGRNLKSAGDSVFNYNSDNSMEMLPGGDEFRIDPFQRSRKLPPLQVRAKSIDDRRWAEKSELSIVEIQ